MDERESSKVMEIQEIDPLPKSAVLKIEPEHIDFGECIDGRPVERRLQVTNTSQGAVLVNVVTVHPAHVSVLLTIRQIFHELASLDGKPSEHSGMEADVGEEFRPGEGRSIISELTRGLGHSRRTSGYLQNPESSFDANSRGHGSSSPTSSLRYSRPSDDSSARSNHSESDLSTPDAIASVGQYFAPRPIRSGRTSPSASRPPSRPASRSTQSSRWHHDDDVDVRSDSTNANENGNFDPQNQRPVQKLEGLLLKAGEAQTIVLTFESTLHGEDPSPGSFRECQFQVLVESCSTERELNAFIPPALVCNCQAKSCASIIEVNSSVLDFGEVDVGKIKVMPLIISNLSEIATRIDLRFLSKVINTYRGEIPVPAKQSVEVKIDLFPRKVNPEYRKEITVANILNRSTDQLVEIRSKNVDRQRVTFHGVFYRILTPSGSNYLDFGSTILNAPSIRTFIIQNLTNSKLVLTVTPQRAEDVVLYLKQSDLKTNLHSHVLQTSTGAKLQHEVSVPTTTEIKERVLETMLNAEKPRAAKDFINGADAETASKSTPEEKTPKDPQGGIDAKAISSTLYLDLAGVKSPKKVASDKSAKLKRLAHESKDLGKHMPALAKSSIGNSASSVPSTAQRSAETGTSPSRAAISSGHQTGSESHSHSPGTLTALKQRKMSVGAVPPLQQVSEMPLERLILYLERQSQNAGHMPTNDAAAKETFIKERIQYYKEARALVHSNRIVPIKIIELGPQEERQVVAIACPMRKNHSQVQSLPKKADLLCFFRLTDFDRNLAMQDYGHMATMEASKIPIREFSFRMNISRSMMDLGQPHINFGHLEKGQTKVKSIVIQNKSEAPLLCHLRKSGSIDSGDIRLSGSRYAFLPAFAKSELEFIFQPSMGGHFQEKVTVENVCDPENNQEIVVKAIVRKPPSFTVEPAAVCLQWTRSCASRSASEILGEGRFAIENTSTKARTYVIEAHVAALGNCFRTLEILPLVQTSRPKLTEEQEEEVESMQQKLKIAVRKNKPDKIRKYEDKLKAFGISGHIQDGTDSADRSANQQEDSKASQHAGVSVKTDDALGRASNTDGNPSKWEDLAKEHQEGTRARADSQISFASTFEADVGDDKTAPGHSPTKVDSAAPQVEMVQSVDPSLTDLTRLSTKFPSTTSLELGVGQTASVLVKLVLDLKGTSKMTSEHNNTPSTLSEASSRNSSRSTSATTSPQVTREHSGTDFLQTTGLCTEPIDLHLMRLKDVRCRLRVHELRNVDETKELILHGGPPESASMGAKTA